MATKVLNPQGWYRLYRDTEIAALKHLADWLLRAGFGVTMCGGPAAFRLRAELSGGDRANMYVRASIKPYRDGSGLIVDADRGGPSCAGWMLDGQDYMFMHDDAEGLVRFAEWFDENRYVNR